MKCHFSVCNILPNWTAVKLDGIVLLVQITLPTTKWEGGKSSGVKTKRTHSSFFFFLKCCSRLRGIFHLTSLNGTNVDSPGAAEQGMALSSEYIEFESFNGLVIRCLVDSQLQCVITGPCRTPAALCASLWGDVGHGDQTWSIFVQQSCQEGNECSPTNSVWIGKDCSCFFNFEVNFLYFFFFTFVILVLLDLTADLMLILYHN